MSLRVILITGANGCLGQAVARVFLAESRANSIWLGVHSRRERAQELARSRMRAFSCTIRELTWTPSLPQVDGKFISAFIRAKKPRAEAPKP